MTSNEYLDAVQKRYLLTSDYALSKALGITRGAISNYRKGIGSLGNDVALKVARLLDLHPAKVVADCNAERTSNDEIRKMWLEIASRFTPQNMPQSERIAQAKARLSA